MNILLYIVQKEFIQIFRNKAILPLILVAPIVQMIVLSFAANNEVKLVHLAVVDMDHSTYSQRLIHKIQASDRFQLIEFSPAASLSMEQLQNGRADIILQIPHGFEKDFLKGEENELQLLVNAINGQQATVGSAYLSQIIQSFNQNIRPDFIHLQAQTASKAQLDIEERYWFNPQLNYQYFMVPGILGELVTILIMLLTAMNVVREREVGTIEQINVSPIKKWQFILGKMLPFVLIGLFLMSVGLTAGKLIFQIPMRGSLIVIFSYCLLNLAAVLGLGLFISNLADTQQQAMLIAFFFVIIFILMSGLFTPIESMPKWAQYLTYPNPIAHFVDVMRKVLLKSSGFEDVLFNFRLTAIMAVVFNWMAVVSYRKVD
ncbi:MAG: ABC transporter permease [Bacteroidota bacterium]